MTKKFITRSLFIVFCTLGIAFAGQVYADDKPSAFRSTQYPLPRFLSLDSDKIYVRTGPGQRYPVKWVFKKKGLPVEIILEYEAWRKIKDYEGEVGWVHQSLLSGRRTGLIQADDLVSVYQKPESDSRLVAYIEPGALGLVKSCEGTWCKFESLGYKGWLKRKFIWGVYEGEDFN